MPNPPPPIPKKLPETYQLTIVKDPEKGSHVRSVVAVVMRGDQVLRRKVVSSFEDVQEALDEFNRIATRAFYFEDYERFGEG